jgi:hypothetical protein
MSVPFEKVREIALSLDGVEEYTCYGTPAFRVSKKIFARLHQDNESLIVRMDADQREALISMDPDTYYTTDHYKGHEWLLVRLSRVEPDALRRLLEHAYNMRAAKKRTR